MSGNHKGSCLNMVFVLKVSLLPTCNGYSNIPSVRGKAIESPSMCLDSPRDKRHWSPQDMVKWGQEKHNTRDGETLALQQRNHRRPLTITKHFTKCCRKRDLVNAVWHMRQYEYSLSGHAVCWPPPEPFYLFTAWESPNHHGYLDSVNCPILRLTENTCMLCGDTKCWAVFMVCQIPHKSDLINVTETRYSSSYLFSEMQAQTRPVFAWKNARNIDPQTYRDTLH